MKKFKQWLNRIYHILWHDLLMRREPFTWQARRIADKHTTKVVIFTGVLFAALSLWTRNNYWLNLSVTTLFVTLLTWFTLHLGKFDDED